MPTDARPFGCHRLPAPGTPEPRTPAAFADLSEGFGRVKIGLGRERVRRLAFESRDRIFDRARAVPATADATVGGTWMPHRL